MRLFVARWCKHALFKGIECVKNNFSLVFGFILLFLKVLYGWHDNCK